MQPNVLVGVDSTGARACESGSTFNREGEDQQFLEGAHRSTARDDLHDTQVSDGSTCPVWIAVVGC